jgi:hypothetical protein
VIVSYDLAVWEGEQPADDADALVAYLSLADKYVEPGSPVSPTARIVRYVEALLQRWPDIDIDIDIDIDEKSPWGTSPLINNAVGPMVYVPMVWSQAQEASAYAADLAKAHGLVCFDPQLKRLRPPLK